MAEIIARLLPKTSSSEFLHTQIMYLKFVAFIAGEAAYPQTKLKRAPACASVTSCLHWRLTTGWAYVDQVVHLAFLGCGRPKRALAVSVFTENTP